MEIVFGGDFFPGRRWEKIILENPSAIWSDEVINFLKPAELKVVNLETPLTNSYAKIDKLGPNLKCNPKVVESLTHADINLVSLANNHIYDFGHEGLTDTITKLKLKNIDFVGVGENRSSAKDAIWDKNNIVILNYCQNEWGCATNSKSGFNGYSLIEICNQIKIHKEKNKFVCLIIHKGHEYFSYPSPNMVKEYRFFIDNGADLIVTHHSHFYSGYEIYKKKHIFYGLGNLLFDSKTKEKRWFSSFLLKIKIQNSTVSEFELLPITNYLSNKKIRVDKSGAFFENIEKINAVISDSKKLNEKWQNHLNYMAASYSIKLNNLSKYRLSVIKRMPFLKKLLIPELKNQLVLKNYFECESHHELIKDLFRK